MIRFSLNTGQSLKGKLTSLVMLLGLASYLIHPLLHHQEMENHSFSHHHYQSADSEQSQKEESTGNHSEPHSSTDDECIHCVLAASTAVSLSTDDQLPKKRANGNHPPTSDRVCQDTSGDGLQLRAPPASV